MSGEQGGSPTSLHGIPRNQAVGEEVERDGLEAAGTVPEERVEQIAGVGDRGVRDQAPEAVLAHRRQIAPDHRGEWQQGEEVDEVDAVEADAEGGDAAGR